MGFLRWLAETWILRLVSGLIMIASALAELSGGEASPVRLHHGALVLGICHVLEALPHLVHGAHDLEQARKQAPGASAEA